MRSKSWRHTALAILLLAGASHVIAEESVPSARLLGTLGEVRTWGETSLLEAAFAADGKRVLTVSKDGSIGEWDFSSGQMRWKSARAGRKGTTPTISPDGAWAAWGTETGFAVTPLGTTGPARPYDDIASVPFMIRFSRDGARVAAATCDGLGVWDVKTGERVGDATWVGGPPTFLAFSEDDASFVVALANREVRRFPVSPGASDGKLELELGDEPMIGLTAGSAIFLVEQRGMIRLVDLVTGKNSTVRWSGESPCGVTVSRDGKWLAAAFGSGFVRLWNRKTDTLVSEVPVLGGALGTLAFSADGRKLVALSLVSAMPCVIDVSTGTCVPDSYVESSRIERIAASPGGRYLATYSDAEVLSVWDVAARSRIWRARGENYLQDLVFSPDETRVLATYQGESEKSLEIFEVKTGRMLAPINPDRGPMAWSPDGSKLACRAGEGFRVCDSLSHVERGLVASERCRFLAIAFSPDGLGLLVVGSKTDNGAVDGNTGFDWLLDEGRLTDGAVLRKPVPIARVVNAAAFSPDAGMLAVRLMGSTRVLDSRTGAPLFETNQPQSSDRDDWRATLSWSSDGKWLASTRKLGKVDVIDVTRGRRALTITGPEGSFTWIPGAPVLASGGGVKGGQILLWDASAPPPPPDSSGDPLLENAWRQLGARSGTGAFRASRSLAQRGEKTAAFLEERMKLPSSPPDYVVALVKRAAAAPAVAGDEAGQAVEKALARALARAGGSAELALRAALENEKVPEIRTRLEALLARHADPRARNAVDRRESWAVRILEEMNSRESLHRIAEGPYRSRVREAAAEALKRLEGEK